MGKHRSKKLKFRHDNRIWSVKIPQDYPSDKTKLRKKRRKLGGYKDVCGFRFPFDVVKALKEDCKCPTCSPRPRTSSRYPVRKKVVSPVNFSHNLVVGERANPRDTRRSAWRDGSAQLLHVTRNNQVPHSKPRAYNHQPYGSPIPSSTEHKQWYDTDEGMTRLQKIKSQIANLPGTTIEVSRGASTHNLCLQFVHNAKKWEITFPANYPRTLPDVEYSDYQRRYQVHVNGTNVLEIVRRNCSCSKCCLYQ